MFTQEEIAKLTEILASGHGDANWQTGENHHQCAHAFLAEFAEKVNLFRGEGLITTGEVMEDNDEFTSFEATVFGYLHKAMACAMAHWFTECFPMQGVAVGPDGADGIFIVGSKQLTSFITEMGVMFERLGMAFVEGELKPWEEARTKLIDDGFNKLFNINND